MAFTLALEVAPPSDCEITHLTIERVSLILNGETVLYGDVFAGTLSPRKPFQAENGEINELRLMVEEQVNRLEGARFEYVNLLCVFMEEHLPDMSGLVEWTGKSCTPRQFAEEAAKKRLPSAKAAEKLADYIESRCSSEKREAMKSSIEEYIQCYPEGLMEFA